jgi:hypothetical protein
MKYMSLKTAPRLFSHLNRLAPLIQKSHLHIHEFQSQELMRREGITVPSALVTTTPTDAEKAAESLGKKTKKKKKKKTFSFFF